MTKPPAYEGDVCFVGQDHEAADGRMLDGGWHYTVIPFGDESMPGEKLVHDPKTNKYRLATDEDTSHQIRHHKRLVVAAVDGWIGEPRTDEEHAAAHRHLDELETRLKKDDLHPQEQTHVLTTPEEIKTMRLWLKRSRP